MVVRVVAGVAGIVVTSEGAAEAAVEGAATEAADSRLARTAAAILPLPDITTEVVGACVT